MVLSDVHIHPQNGRVDGRLLTSIFPLSLAPRTQTLDGEDKEDTLQNNDGDQDWDHAVEIQHAMGTSLRAVGSQVWMGSFLLIDWMVTLIPELDRAVVLELGAGTGLASIACSLLTPADIFFCTDFDTAVLLNCQQNIDTNLQGFLGNTGATTTAGAGHVLCRRLNWLMDCPLDPVEEEPDQFSWMNEDRNLWISQGAYIIAADGNEHFTDPLYLIDLCSSRRVFDTQFCSSFALVVYDDSLTDALVECLERLLKEPLPEDHPRHSIGRVAFVTMEKRYNFSLDQLAVVAQAYDYFVRKISESLVIEAERIDPSTLERHCDYDRSKDLVSNWSGKNTTFPSPWC